MEEEEVGLNEQQEIDPSEIFPEVEARLRSPIPGLPACFVFRCRTCGRARRDPSISDPADLFSPRTCAQAGASCSDPDCGEEPSRIQFLPGSFVLANDSGQDWPAMVDFYPSPSAEYCLRNIHQPVPFAYWVVFLGVDRDRVFGGWFTLDRLRPVPTTEALGENGDPILRRALKICDDYRDHSLRQRLLSLSHSAAQLRLQGYSMNGHTR